jgi:hypothetical protein
MGKSLRVDLNAAHRYFSANCSSNARDLIEKPDRTPEEDLERLHRAIAGTWHWSQRRDCTATNRSVGIWQVSRIYALLGQAEIAHHYGQLRLKASQEPGVEPFHPARAHEALARADLVAGKLDKMRRHLADARQIAEQLAEGEEREALPKDLATIVPP